MRFLENGVLAANAGHVDGQGRNQWIFDVGELIEEASVIRMNAYRDMLRDPAAQVARVRGSRDFGVEIQKAVDGCLEADRAQCGFVQSRRAVSGIDSEPLAAERACKTLPETGGVGGEVFSEGNHDT